MIDYKKLVTLADLANSLAAVDGEAVIAGGAPRNLLTGLPVRDIDVFAPTGSLGRLHLFEEVLGRKLAPVVTDSSADPYFGYRTYRSEDGKVDVVFVSDVQDHIDKFEDDLSQIYIDTTGLVVTPNALKALAAKRITLAPNVKAARVEKMRALYPDWEFLGPLD